GPGHPRTAPPTGGPFPRPVPPPGPPPAQTPGNDTRSLLKAVGRRWFLAVSLGSVVALAAAAAAWFLLPPQHTAFAHVPVGLFNQVVYKSNLDGQEGKTEFDTYKRLQMSSLKNRFVLNAALKKPEIKKLRIVQEQPDPLTWLEDLLQVQSKEGSEIVTVSLA